MEKKEEKKAPKKRTKKENSVETAMMDTYSSAQRSYLNTMKKLLNANS